MAKDSTRWSAKTRDMIAFLVINLALAWPAAFASGLIDVAQNKIEAPNASPLGYTWSLVLFWVPCLIFGIWTLYVVKDSARRWAFSITICLLIPLGVILDLFFGAQFLTFHNKTAVIASKWGDFWTLPAYFAPDGGIPSWFGGIFRSANWKRYIPVEEIAFYILGFITILFTYVWADAIIFRRHKVDRRQQIWNLFATVRGSLCIFLIIGAVLCLIGFAIQMYLNPDGFPGYFLFLLACSILPTIICFPVAFHFVNWRAMTVAWLFVLIISQYWEATLGVPYRWWGYNDLQMLGWFILPQCSLPVEAVLVWSLGTWTTVVVYETILAIFSFPPPSAPPASVAVQSTPPPSSGTGAPAQPGFVQRFKQRSAVAYETLATAQSSKRVADLKEMYDAAGESKQARAREAAED